MSKGTDVSKFLSGLAKAGAAQRAAALHAVDRFGEHLIGDAQQLTPVKTGALQASGTTTTAQIDGETITKLMGFNTDYAAAVHERLDLNHAVGQPKFLETAMRENAPKFVPFVSNEMKKGS
jgi:hypothetical protein